MIFIYIVSGASASYILKDIRVGFSMYVFLSACNSSRTADWIYDMLKNFPKIWWDPQFFVEIWEELTMFRMETNTHFSAHEIR
jgi:hypothetical protein